MKFPWDPEYPDPEYPDPPASEAAQTDKPLKVMGYCETPALLETTVQALQRDFAYAITHTAVLVRSNRPALEMLVNTLRGQVIPRNEGHFSDGTTLEFQDVGMPQVGAPEMSVEQLIAHVLDVAEQLGLKL